MKAHLPDYVIIAVYLLLMMAVGATFRRLNRNSVDYFRSGSQGTWWLVGASVFMGAFSAWTFTGAAGIAYEAGLSILTIYVANTLGLLAHAAFLAGWLRQLRATTAPEVISLRFGETTRQFYAWVSVVMQLILSALFLYGMGIFSASAFGLPLRSTLIGLGGIVMICCTLGGSWGIMASDFLQGIIKLAVTTVLAFLCLHAVGGPAALWRAIHDHGLAKLYQPVKPDGLFPNHQFTATWTLAMLVHATIGMMSPLTGAGRYFSVKNAGEARRAALLAAVVTLFGSLIWFLPPMTARLLYSQAVDAMPLAKPAESSYAVASLHLLPAGVTGLMVVAMFAATMSTMDAGINRNAAILIRDIYPALCRLLRRPARPFASLLWASQVASLGLGILVILLALRFAASTGGGVFEAMISLGVMLGTPITLPVLLGFFFRRMAAWSALSSAGASIGVNLGAWVTGWHWDFQTQILWTVLAGTLGFAAGRLGWPRATPAYREQVDTFFTRMRTPIDYAREVGEQSDSRQARLIGRFAVVMGALMLGLLLLPNPASGRLIILAIAAFTAGIGALMLAAARRRSS